MTRQHVVDVCVVGGGAAGTLAAVAAKRAGARVTLVRRGDGATQQSSGAVDVAEDHGGRPLGPRRHALEGGLPYLDAARSVAHAYPAHPYARAEGCLEAIPEALRMLGEVARGVALVGRDDGNNLVMPTTLGTFKRTAWVQGSMVGASLGRGRSGVTLVVHVPHLAQGDGHVVAATLQHVAGLGDGGRDALGRVEVVTLSAVTSQEDALMPVWHLAGRLLSDAVKEALVDVVMDAARRFGPVAAVVLPPAFGGVGSAAWVAEVGATLGMPVGEMLSAPASVPGLRLQNALDEGAAREGVDILDAKVTHARVEKGRVIQLHARPAAGLDEHLIKPRAVVMCTGKYLSGGIRRDGTFVEPLLNLPLFLDNVPVSAGFIGAHVAERPEDPQPFMRVGVLTDGTMRPLDHAQAAPALTGVFAAGSLLAGYDPGRMGTGLGLAAVTGMLAGRAAVAFLAR